MVQPRPLRRPIAIQPSPERIGCRRLSETSSKWHNASNNRCIVFISARQLTFNIPLHFSGFHIIQTANTQAPLLLCTTYYSTIAFINKSFYRFDHGGNQELYYSAQVRAQTQDFLFPYRIMEYHLVWISITGVNNRKIPNVDFVNLLFLYSWCAK